MRALLAILVLAFPATLSGQAPTLPPGIAWQPDFGKALKMAEAEKKPIMIAFLMKDEPANKEIMRGHFKNQEIIDESRKFVCMVGCLGLSETVEGVRADGTTGKVSAELGAALPQEIAQVEMQARQTYMSSNKVSAPQFLFLMPDGESLLLRHVWMLAPSELLKKMKMAYAYFDPESAPSGFKEHKDRVTRALEEADADHATKRREALRTLATMDDPRVLEFLIKQTSAEADTQKRLEAIFFMRERGNAKALDCLHGLLEARDSQTRMFTAVTLEGIAMRESGEHLVKALKRETKDRVRSHLLRALAACLDDPKELEEVLLRQMKSRGQLDRVTAIRLSANMELSKDLTIALLKSLKDSNSQVRCAAYVTVGHLRVERAKELIEGRIGAERGNYKDIALWCLEQLGGEPYTGETDPDEIIRDMLPDQHLYEGSLEDPNPRGRGGRGRGGR